MSRAGRGGAAALVVFAKQPRAGEVKTRLCPPLRPEQAAGLYEAMLADVLEASSGVARAHGFALIVAVAPPEAAAQMAIGVPPSAAVVAQRGSGLAERMSHAIAECAAAGFSRIVLRGSDSPALDPAQCAEAADALATHDLAIAPDVDGGYNLLAVRRPHRGLLDHPMSTASVARDTLARARALGLRTKQLAPGFDIDVAEDLTRLARLRAAASASGARPAGLGPARPLRAQEPGLRPAEVAADTDACRRTLAWLDREGLWPPA